jgi:hypothetical protein
MRHFISLTLLLSTFAAGSASARAPLGRGHESDDTGQSGCVTPDGIDLCALTGIVASFDGPVHAGDLVAELAVWEVNLARNDPARSLPLTYKPGYCDDPSNDCNDPLADLRHKLTSVRLERIEITRDITDPGSPITLDTRSRSIVYRDVAALSVVFPWAEIAPQDTALALTPTLGITVSATAGEVGPTRRGNRLIQVQHRDRLYWTLSAEACDGVPILDGESLDDHCIPAGETFMQGHRFTVLPRN